MIGNLLRAAAYGIAASKVEPGMVLTAARDIFITVLGRDGIHRDIPFAHEGDQIRIEGEDVHRDGDLFVCTNLDNYDEVSSIETNDLDDTLKEYT